MAADGIEEGTPGDKAGAGALVFWSLVMLVPSQGPCLPSPQDLQAQQDTHTGPHPWA